MADRLGPASLFLLFLAAKGQELPGLLALAGAAEGHQRWQSYTSLASYGLTCLFLAAVVSLFVVRRPSLLKQEAAWPRGVAVAATFSPVFLAARPTAGGGWIHLVAGSLVTVGLAIALAGLLTLRRRFGILPEARGMVTSGLYGHLRHPMYLGESIATLGIGLPALSPLSMALLAAYFLLQGRRALNEEAVLTAAYPRYREYAFQTKRFLPGLW